MACIYFYLAPLASFFSRKKHDPKTIFFRALSVSQLLRVKKCPKICTNKSAACYRAGYIVFVSFCFMTVQSMSSSNGGRRSQPPRTGGFVDDLTAYAETVTGRDEDVMLSIGILGRSLNIVPQMSSKCLD